MIAGQNSLKGQTKKSFKTYMDQKDVLNNNISPPRLKPKEKRQEDSSIN